ncbi:MAG: hypothetical protein ACRDGF_10195 [Chloroflexota bacterium]
MYLDEAQLLLATTGGKFHASVSTAGTTVVKASAGRLARLMVLGNGGTLGTVTVHDSLDTSGPIVYGPTTPSAGDVIELQIPCASGITVVTAAATTLLLTYS